jgi:serine/threonine protein kinase
MEYCDHQVSTLIDPPGRTIEPISDPSLADTLADEPPLFELLARWQERYLQREDPTLEQLGVEDAALRQLLGERIQKQKRLLGFLALPLPLSTEETVDRGMVQGDGNERGGRTGTMGMVTRIGRYLVVEFLGRGAQGDVYRVVHPELGKELVIKLARRSAAVNTAERDRMIREGRLLAGCDHPNLVRVVDLDFHEGRPFVVMEHVRGRNLEQYAEERRVEPRQAAALAIELARAVTYIHERGVLHLDIKPKNILIGEETRPKLIDFGLARLRHAWTEDPNVSSGGTTSYMSPEQANCDEARIGPWTDVFGLGGVLFYLLTGRPVYQNTPEASALQRACKGDQVSPRRINPRVPRCLERICLKALAIDPERRYRTAEELERALHRFLLRPRVIATGAAVLSLAAVASLGLRLPPDPGVGGTSGPDPIPARPASTSAEAIPRIGRPPQEGGWSWRRDIQSISREPAERQVEIPAPARRGEVRGVEPEGRR